MITRKQNRRLAISLLITLAVLFAFAMLAMSDARADGGHHKPKPTTTQAPEGCDCWWQPVLTTAAAVGAVYLGYTIWESCKEDPDVKARDRKKRKRFYMAGEPAAVETIALRLEGRPDSVGSAMPMLNLRYSW